MRFCYTILTYLSIPILLLRLLYRCLTNPTQASRWYERFAYYRKPLPQQGIWIHAVSLGEVNAVLTLIKRLKQQCNTLPIIISTTTLTGATQVERQLGDSVRHVFLTYDLYGATQRFLKKLQPKIGIIVETELWPNLLYHCQRQKIPLLLANARLSEKSAKGYARLQPLTQSMLQSFQHLAIQTHDEALRFMQLGASTYQISVTGNIKFDQPLAIGWQTRQQELRTQWGPNRLIWLAASTHKGEDILMIKTFTKLKAIFPNLLLVLVPRHPERFNEVYNLCQHHSCRVIRASDHKNCDLNSNIFLGDTMGDLPYYFSAADITFIGGSLVPTGGHNSLEAAIFGVVTITGPHTFNFKKVNELLKQAGALFEVADDKDLYATVQHLLHNTKLRQAAGAKALAVINQNRGALQMHIDLISTMLTKN